MSIDDLKEIEDVEEWGRRGKLEEDVGGTQTTAGNLLRVHPTRCAERLREERREDGMGMGNGRREPFEGCRTRFFGVSEGRGGRKYCKREIRTRKFLVSCTLRKDFRETGCGKRE